MAGKPGRPNTGVDHSVRYRYPVPRAAGEEPDSQVGCLTLAALLLGALIAAASCAVVAVFIVRGVGSLLS